MPNVPRSAKTSPANRRWWKRPHQRPIDPQSPSSSRPGLLADWAGLSSRIRVLLGLAALIWVAGIAFGSLYAFQFETTPGETTVAPDRCPSGSPWAVSSQRPTLVMFVHPRCSCSRSSLSELSVLMTRCRGLVEAQVVFLQPRSLPADWSQTDLWDFAARIPGVTPQQDFDGVEHRRFGANVSGEVFVYRAGGELLFHGGITAGRGHEGANRGRAAIESLLLDRVSDVRATPVFGCNLESREAISAKCDVKDGEGQEQ